MPTKEQEQKERGRLIAALENLSQITPESLVRHEELGLQSHFGSGVDDFKRIYDLFAELRKCSFDEVPHSKVVALAGKAEEALKNFRDIQEFSLVKYPNNPTAERDRLITRVHDSYDEMYNTIMPILGYFARKQTDLEAIAYEAKQAVSSIRDLEANAKREFEDKNVEATRILDSMRKVAAEWGVSQNAIYFSEEAKEHAQEAKRWLTKMYWMVSIVFVFALALSVYYAFGKYELSSAHTVQLAISKIVLFSALFFALAVCNKNYRAHRHNYVVNKHRQNALATFQAFVKGAGTDEATKSAILLKSAETIFSPVSSGYLSKEPEPQGTAQVLEIVRGFLGKESS